MSDCKHYAEDIDNLVLAGICPICRIAELQQQLADDRLGLHEFKTSLQKYLTEADVVEELRLLADSMSTHKALADKIGVSPAYLHDVLAGRRHPGPAIFRFLRLDRVTVYRELR